MAQTKPVTSNVQAKAKTEDPQTKEEVVIAPIEINTVEDIDGTTQVGKLLIAALEIIANRVYEGNHSLAITKVKSKAELMFPTESIK